MRLLVTFVCGAVLCFGQAAGQLSGRRAPGFSLPDSSFHRYDLQDFRGKWLLLDFLESHCPHCRVLAKMLEQVKAHYGAKVAILEIVLAPPETMQTVAEYVKDSKVTSPVLYDQGQVAASYFNATPEHNSYDTPHLFIIDPNGMIVKDFSQYEGQGLIKDLDLLMAAHK
jgi:peroxiredoxin